MNEVAEVLVRARDLLASSHWCKHVSADAYGNYCAGGAISYVSLTLEDAVSAYRKLGRYTSSGNVAAFNDAEETTLADVIALFDKALADIGAPHEAPQKIDAVANDEGGKITYV